MLLSHPDRIAGSHWTSAGVARRRATIAIGLIHVITDLSHHVALEGVICHRSGLLEDGDLIRRDGMLCTSPLRTVIDLSGPLTVPNSARSSTIFFVESCSALEELRARVDRTRPAPGRSVATLRQVLAQRLPGYDPGESELEGRIARIIDAHGLPRPAHQHRVQLWKLPVSDRPRLARSQALPGGQRLRLPHAGDRSRQRRSSSERARARRLGSDRDHLAR